MLQPFGIIPAMVTPLTGDDELNQPALRKLTNFLIDNGVHGVFATGSQGEFWAFSAAEKQRVLDRAAAKLKRTQIELRNLERLEAPPAGRREALVADREVHEAELERAQHEV
ncbi:MAG: dihydrodipicolinate synthase family protein, partial [Anaerolineales bacterium]